MREVEAWLLADADSLARYLEVPRTRIPRDPEGREDPKGDWWGWRVVRAAGKCARIWRQGAAAAAKSDQLIRDGSSTTLKPFGVRTSLLATPTACAAPSNACVGSSRSAGRRRRDPT